MKILFIHSTSDWYRANKPINLKKSVDIQFGISYISAFLKKHGHKTELLVLNGYIDEKRINKKIKSYDPKVVCFSPVFREYEFIIHVSKYIKNYFPKIYQIAGGPHVSINPEMAINDTFDAICIGEGEYPTLELISHLERKITPRKIKNLWIKTKKGIEKNSVRQFLQDLDRLPIPDREMWTTKYDKKKSREVILIGRGCPFPCTYCCNHRLKKTGTGKYVRFRSASNIVKEIENLLIIRPGLKHIYFEAEAINLNLSFLKELCTYLIEFNDTISCKLTYGANMRVIEGQDHRMISEYLSKANFKTINIGMESGSEKIRKNILRRNYSNRMLLEICNSIRSTKMNVVLYVMMGIPGESIREYKKTINLCRICKPKKISLSIFFPYPGTDLFDYCKERKWIPERLSPTGRGEAILNMPTFSKKQIQKEFYNFYPKTFSNNIIQYKFLQFLILGMRWFGGCSHKLFLFFISITISLIKVKSEGSAKTIQPDMSNE